MWVGDDGFASGDGGGEYQGGIAGKVGGGLEGREGSNGGFDRSK